MRKIISLVLSLVMITSICAFSSPASAAGGMAFSVGTDYGLFDVDTSSDATTACDLYAIAGYSSYYSTQPTVSVMKGSFSNGVKRIQSDILFFSGHSNYDHMSFNYNGNDGQYKTGVYYGDDVDDTEGYSYVGINGNMSTVKLVTFAGCLTAANGNNNITSKAVTQGADAAVGWTSSVYAGSHSNWLARYNDKLSTGSTVLAAVTYANSFTYVDSNVKDAKIYGNNQKVIKLTRTSSVLEEELCLNKTIITENIDVSARNSLNIAAITSLIEQKYEGFNSEEYMIDIHNICDNCYTIDYIRMIDNIETNSCYTVTVINNKVSEIIDNTKPINESQLNVYNITRSISTKNMVSNSLLTAQTEIEKSEQKDLKEQSSKYYYDVETDKLKLIIFSSYYFDDTTAVGKDAFIQVIN